MGIERERIQSKNNSKLPNILEDLTFSGNETVIETKDASKNDLNDKKTIDQSNQLLNSFEFLSINNSSSSSSSVSALPSQSSLSNCNSIGQLRVQLILHDLNPKLVDDVLNKYKGETDIEKLIFLARGISFLSDF